MALPKKNTKIAPEGAEKNSSSSAKQKAIAREQRIIDALPLEASLEDSNYIQASCSEGRGGSGVRSNIAGQIPRTNAYAFIENGVSPIGISNRAGTNSCTSPREAIRLCQLAYYNISIFRNTIDLMTEFTCSPIAYVGGNEIAQKFFNAWDAKINMWSFQDQFFREYYRGGNNVIYKLFAEFSRADLPKLKKIFGEEAKLGGKTKIPGRYIILNAADLEFESCCWLDYANIFKVINEYELRLLLNSTNEIDKDIAEQIPELKQITNTKQKGGVIGDVKIKLDRDRLVTVFYKKQDYEACCIPFGFPVLRDINAKEELKNIDMAINRHIQQALLLVTMGNETDGPAPKEQMVEMRKMFENPSVARVLVAAYDTHAEFVIPTIGDIIDPKKYEILDRDIRLGLNNVLFGEDEKYSGASIKVEVFLSRLKHAREAFLREFLIPEMKLIAKELNFKDIPQPEFENSDFKDDVLRAKLYSHLIEIGTLTHEEGIDAIKTGRLPIPTDSLESQKKFRKYRDDRLFEPVLNTGAADGEKGGNPGGGNAAPKSKKPSVPGGKSKASYDVNKIKSVFDKIGLLSSNVESSLRSKYGIKSKRLNKDQKEIAAQLVDVIICNEGVADWESAFQSYIDNPTKKNKDVFDKVNEIALAHEISLNDLRQAAVLFNSTLI